MDELGAFVFAAFLAAVALFGHWSGRIYESSDTIYSCTHFQKYEPQKGKWIECRMVAK